MKKIWLSLIVIVLLPSFTGHAQDSKGRPTAQLTNEYSTSQVLLGRINTTNTTRELILLDPRLIPQQVNCQVASYTFIISSASQTWGPVTVNGPKLNDAMKNRITDWDEAGVTITFKDIRLKCDGQEMAGAPITLKYDH